MAHALLDVALDAQLRAEVEVLDRAVAQLQELARDGDRQLEVRGVLRLGVLVLLLDELPQVLERLHLDLRGLRGVGRN